MKRPVEEKVAVTIGGYLNCKYKHYGDDLEVVLIIRSGESFYGVVARGRQAYRAYHVDDGKLVEVKGALIQGRLPQIHHWKPLATILCEKLRVGDKSSKQAESFDSRYSIPATELFKKIGTFGQEPLPAKSKRRI